MEKAIEEDHLDETGQRGQYLWIRGLTRLQHQVTWLHVLCVARYFGKSVLVVVIDFIADFVLNCFFLQFVSCWLDKVYDLFEKSMLSSVFITS